MVVRVPEATLEAKHDALHVQPYGLAQEEKKTMPKRNKGRDGEGWKNAVSRLLQSSFLSLNPSFLERERPDGPCFPCSLREEGFGQHVNTRWYLLPPPPPSVLVFII